ncbi:unnamed protein product [Caenorhabditis brenneri]
MAKAMLGYSRKEGSEELYGVLEELDETTENHHSSSIGDIEIQSGDFQLERNSMRADSRITHNLCSTSDGRGDEDFVENYMMSKPEEAKSSQLKRAYTPENDEKITEPKPRRKTMRRN